MRNIGAAGLRVKRLASNKIAFLRNKIAFCGAHPGAARGRERRRNERGRVLEQRISADGGREAGGVIFGNILSTPDYLTEKD